MKKTLSILLILFIIINSGGYLFIYLQLENYFKKIAFNRINEFIPIEKLERIEISNNSKSTESKDYIRFIDDREICYKGKMYDIYMVFVQDGKTIIYCISDENEDIINNAFSEYINESDGDLESQTIINFVKIIITLALEPIQSDFSYIQPYKNISFNYINLFGNINIDIPSPPPKFIA